MTVQVNLLPGPYRLARRHHRRYRLGVLLATALLSVELVIGLVFHIRADKTRVLYAAIDATEEAIHSLKTEMVEPTRQVNLLTQQVTLATRLRTKHHWSRLLGTMAQLAPKRVVLSTFITNPAQWSASLYQAANNIKTGNKKQNEPQVRMLNGITVQGYAMSHEDLYEFVNAIQSSKMFASIDLKDARRDQYLGQEAIVFELQCNW